MRPFDLREDDLPEPFALLAQQLSGDAARLAELYPPGIRDTGARPSAVAQASRALPRRWPRRLAWVSAAAILLVASLEVVERVRNVPEPVWTPAVAERDVAGTSRMVVVPVDAALWIDESGFDSLSRPAQEAILDLFEDDVLAQDSLSI
ncbi:MAG: hypothetical protein HYX69_11650 [Planctomycetia bacterium]|nr:hypothetical protein [Planctomycetia bacterium]